MLNSLPVRLLWHSLNWLTRLAVVVSVAFAMLLALAIIALRYWLLPDIEQYHDEIELSFSAAIGNPVRIGNIEGNWQGLEPRLKLNNVSILDAARQPALVLPQISGSLSWMSLVSAELRLASLEIDNPVLLVHRDAQGRLFVGGVALNNQDSGNDLSDWLLHQSRMLVRDALIIWLDDRRAAPPLVLRQVNLRIDNLFNHHRFALRALPPGELASPLDLRGDFYGRSFDEPGKWRGQLFTQLDYTNVTAWRPWLNLPSEFSSGRGALRGWLDVENGKPTGVTADLALRNVVTRLSGDVPEMRVASVSGRAAWKEVAGGFEVSTRQLALRLQNGIELPPTDFFLRTVKPVNGQPGGGEIRASQLQLETLVSLSGFLPLDADLRAQLEQYAPRGKVSNLDAQWQGAGNKLTVPRIKGQFDNLVLRQVGSLPGFSGLSLDVDGGDAGGRLNINSRDLAVDAPGVMREPLSFVTLTGQAGWRRKQGELAINVDNVAFANADAAGNAYGGFQTKAGTLGVLDLTVSLTRGDVRQAARYTPLVAVGKEASDWLSGALQAGHTEDLRVRVKGNLSNFPLDGRKDGLLEIGGHARDVVLEFDKAWPRIENITGELLIRGNRLEVKSPSATILGAQVKDVTVTLADMMSPDLPLEVKGEADAPGNVFLQYIQQSPVRGYIDGFTDGMSASGNGHLTLYTYIPLLGKKPVRVNGSVRVLDNDISLGAGMPLLRRTNGTLLFTEAGMKADNVAAEIMGGPASLNVETLPGGVVHATARGRSNFDALRATQPLPDYLHGGAPWDADISVRDNVAQLVLNSSLQGVSLQLPAPFAKSAAEAAPLHLEMKPLPVKLAPPSKDCPAPCRKPAAGEVAQSIVRLQLGRLLSAQLLGRDENGAMALKRGTIMFGAPDKWDAASEQALLQGKDGVWLTGSIPLLSLQGWESLTGSASGASSAMTIAGAKLKINKVTGYGQVINDLSIDATRGADGFVAQLTSAALNGEVEWLPHGHGDKGKLSAKLRNLQLQLGEQSMSAPATGVATAPTRSGADTLLRPGELPELELIIDNLQVKNRAVGRCELSGNPDGRDWRLRRINIANPDGNLSGEGVWLGDRHGAKDAANEKTSLNLQLEISDAGKMLDRFGYPNAVKKGSGKLVANLSWPGRPDEFGYARLDGTLKLDTGKGQFLKMEPGIGKLLSILSLQALPKRITLDFTDVFSDGFQFDNINGNATIRRGVMDTQDFHIDGSSAKVTMKGSVDLVHETQNLHVVILPTIGDSVSLLGAFAAGPAVGIGTLIVQKVLGNPLDKLVAFEYNISGTWSDPNVVKVGKKPVKQQENNP